MSSNAAPLTPQPPSASTIEQKSDGGTSVDDVEKICAASSSNNDDDTAVEAGGGAGGIGIARERSLYDDTLDMFRMHELLEGSEVYSEEPIDIGPGDALIVVDMQNDFMPSREEYKVDGALAVTEGDLVIDPICDLIRKFHAAGGVVCPSRDYHPAKHLSFASEGGWFPDHCVYNTPGSKISEQVSKCLQELPEGDVNVFYKGFLYGFDSFGAFPYANDSHKDRVLHTKDCSSRGGAITLPGCSAVKYARDRDGPITPERLASATDGTTLEDYLRERDVKRIFSCGLALQYCVLDTAVNGADAGFESHFLLDCTRAVCKDESGEPDFHPPTMAKSMYNKVTKREMSTLRFPKKRKAAALHESPKRKK